MASETPHELWEEPNRREAPQPREGPLRRCFGGEDVGTEVDRSDTDLSSTLPCSCFKNRTVYRRVGRRAGPSCPCPLRGDVTCICPRTAAQDADDRSGERRAQSETQAKRAFSTV